MVRMAPLGKSARVKNSPSLVVRQSKNDQERLRSPKVVRNRSLTVQKAIRAGKVVRGMTRDQVIISLGYPRTDMTSSLDASAWKYTTADGYEYELVWGVDGLLDDVRAAEAEALKVVLLDY